MTAQPSAPGARPRVPIGWEGWDGSRQPGPAKPAPIPAEPARGLVPSLPLYLGVGLVAGAVIALQICIMRIFSVGSWAHFGSLVVSLAMLAFGLVSAVMCIGKGFFARHWRAVAGTSLVLFAPLLVGANLLAQQVPFNAIFLLSDPNQKWRLAANFAPLPRALPGRRAVPRHRVPQGRPLLRPRLLRRPRRRGPRRPAVPRHAVPAAPREPRRHADPAGAGRRPLLVLRRLARRRALRRGPARRRRCCSPSAPSRSRPISSCRPLSG